MQKYKGMERKRTRDARAATRGGQTDGFISQQSERTKANSDMFSQANERFASQGRNTMNKFLQTEYN
jgi:hypothetical protein